MTEFRRNAFKAAIAAGKLQIGLWSSLCSNVAAEIIGDSGFDWILLDTEHSPNEIPDLVTQLQALQAGTATPIIRPAWNDAVLAKRCLDIGAQTLLFPYVQNVEEAKRAVASTRYPPQGIRGVSVASRASRYGRTPGYRFDPGPALNSPVPAARRDQGYRVAPESVARDFPSLPRPRRSRDRNR